MLLFKRPLGAVWWAEAESRGGDRMALLGQSDGLEDESSIKEGEVAFRGWGRKRGSQRQF